MQLPTIHLNGTSADSLLDSLGAAADALEAAYQALKQTAPNGRDYYPQGPAAMGAARSEHEARLKKIDQVKDEIEAMIGGIYDLKDA